jgi:hypothetical protein
MGPARRCPWAVHPDRCVVRFWGTFHLQGAVASAESSACAVLKDRKMVRQKDGQLWRGLLRCGFNLPVPGFLLDASSEDRMACAWPVCGGAVAGARAAWVVLIGLAKN